MDNKRNKIPTSIEIVDVPPPAYNETEEIVSAGTTQLSKDELHHLFNNRNSAFVATLSKDGSPHITPVWTEMVVEGADGHLKRLAKKYLGIEKYYYRKPSHKRIIIKIQPERIMGLSIHPAFYFLAYSPWNR